MSHVIEEGKVDGCVGNESEEPECVVFGVHL